MKKKEQKERIIYRSFLIKSYVPSTRLTRNFVKKTIVITG